MAATIVPRSPEMQPDLRTSLRSHPCHARYWQSPNRAGWSPKLTNPSTRVRRKAQLHLRSSLWPQPPLVGLEGQSLRKSRQKPYYVDGIVLEPARRFLCSCRERDPGSQGAIASSSNTKGTLPLHQLLRS